MFLKLFYAIWVLVPQVGPNPAYLSVLFLKVFFTHHL